MFRNITFLMVFFVLFCNVLIAQVVINEGSNRNYSVIADENGEYPDWIELYNAGSTTVHLLNYSLSDDSLQPAKWTFPNISLLPGEFRVVFCSGKDRKPVSGFVNVVNTGVYNPHVGWNTHSFTAPFHWDGVSNLLINTCSYSSTGYTSNSVFNQTPTMYPSTSFSFADGSASSCTAVYGTRVNQRPNIKLNGHAVGTGQIQNSPTGYPAPYGNWYWGARHQILIHASELSGAGVPVGNLSSISFDVVSTDPNTVYDYIDIHMRLVSYDEVPIEFEPVDTNNFLHTNFKISKNGEKITLYSPNQVIVSQLFVNCNDLDNSIGLFHDGSSNVFLFQLGTPSSTNNLSKTYLSYLQAPVFSVPSGFYEDPVSVMISNPNTVPCTIHYTIDGSEPNLLSPTNSGEPVIIPYSAVLKARAFSDDDLPSPNTVATYFFGVEHTTPILSVITDNQNLYGPNGIFDNWWYDWEKSAYVEYFDSTQNLIFSQRAGIQIDGGWGGARANAQHSFRIELDDAVLGEGHIHYHMIPGRPDRTKYSKFYLRNGSNQFLAFPYKDACETTMMGGGLNNYYAAWRPISVYINGYYFGLYELREKFDAEYFETLEEADPAQTDLLSVSAWYGYALRAVEGSSEGFLEDYAAFNLLNPADTGYWKAADSYFDLTWYTDYIIGESWIANNDWPYNNIKIYRSDKTNYRWRFCLVDLELSLLPNGWTDCNFDHIQFMLNNDPNIPYINIWMKSIQNDQYRNYFINRFADVMNTAYRIENLTAIENGMYGQTVVEMQKEYARWGDPNNIPAQMLNFAGNHIIFQSQLEERTGNVRNHILSNFNLPNLVDVTLNVYPEGAGKIQISTITPAAYPWQGVYFNGIPVKIEAIANDGFNFLNWGDNGIIDDTLNIVFLDTLNTATVSFDAYFEDLTANVPSMEGPVLFSVNPNPASSVLSIHNRNMLTEDINYQIIDMNGRIVKEGKFSGNSTDNQVNIFALPPSVYLLRISDSKSILSNVRFVKM